MEGTKDVVQLQAVVDAVKDTGMISGMPGTFTISALYSVATTVMDIDGGGKGTPLSPLNAALVHAAIKKSNDAARATPSAASGKPTGASTSATLIDRILEGIPVIGSTSQDIRDIESGAEATLNWWGWSLNLNESATQAMRRLLNNDLETVAKILMALAAISAPLAAAGAVLKLAAGALAAWISDEDTRHDGVTIAGYLWVGVKVTGN